MSDRLALAAVDLGASSGRVMLGRVGPDTLELTEVNRFRNGAVRLPDGLYWDVLGLYQDILDRPARRPCGRPTRWPGSRSTPGPSTTACSTRTARCAATRTHYRDPRTEAVDRRRCTQQVDPARLYAVNGLQFLPFNTLYQLAAEPDLQHARRCAADPGPARLLAHRPARPPRRPTPPPPACSTPAPAAGRRSWSRRSACRPGCCPTSSPPGEVLAPLSPRRARRARGRTSELLVTTVGSHDTASAVVGVPADGPALRLHLLRHLGRWSASSWTRRCSPRTAGGPTSPTSAASTAPSATCATSWGCGCCRSRSACVEPARRRRRPAATCSARPPPCPPAARGSTRTTRCSCRPATCPSGSPQACRDAGSGSRRPRPRSSGASSTASPPRSPRRSTEAERLSGQPVEVVHLVGGGSQNALLCQLTADACRRPVVAGPVEATALGNLLVQARTHGVLAGDLAALRERIRRTVDADPVRAARPCSLTRPWRCRSPVGGPNGSHTTRVL